MVESNEDPSVIEMQRSYDLKQSLDRTARGIPHQAGADADGRLDVPYTPRVDNPPADDPAAQEAVVVVPSAQPPSPPEADASFRKARLGCVAVIVLVLILLWIRQRRSE